MGHSTLTRCPPFARHATLVPSAPIPIPHVRRVTDPPPRSPTRYQTSSDLIFEMSPHVVNETPLTAYTKSVLFNDFDPSFIEKSTLPTAASRFGYMRRPHENAQPYAEEPFLYSIPRFSAHSSAQHSRTQSAVVYGTQQDSSLDTVQDKIVPRYSDSFTIMASSPADDQSVLCSDTTNSDRVLDEVLTTAFQQSFTSSSSSVRSFICSSTAYCDHSISPPVSIEDVKFGRSIRIPSILRKKSSIITPAMPAGIRTSAAEPVVSFAQAELKRSPSSGMIARVVRASKETSRVQSPYHAHVRGRRNSLRPRGNKVSDDDLAGTLKESGLSEKPGFERFLPGPLTRHRVTDEKKFTDEALERGRALSRTRAGRRL
ncbi:hypothetical protein BDY19DRAFT_171043 [Irpex rosettiformis]|uniref:Uncharacterized protein n=1 Tax=Irpex rosettiformis TaxID=378272 RepID=A0ACB8U2F8_9APHY|nr:hypothetical protein BDY19DRAFT_171043 [Irpex rosettiformis]